MNNLKYINKMASLYRHATLLRNINHNLFICILISLLLPRVHEGAKTRDNFSFSDGDGRRLTREYHLRQGALRGLIVRPSRHYDLQSVEIFLGIPYAAPPVANLRFMPPVSAPPWPGVKMATKFAPVCPQNLPPIKKDNPPSLGRQNYRLNLETFLRNESEDCLYLNIYVPYREQRSKKFPVLVFIHGDSFEYSSGNPYDGRVLAAYGNIMVVTINYRLGILGFMKPSLTEYVYGNNGLLDQLAALQWIKDNIEDLNGDPNSVTIMGHGTGAACVNYLMLSPISNGLFHRAILMSGSALSDWALTRDPAQYTLQVAQSLGCNPSSKDMMTCLQKKPLSDIKKIQILARDFETPLGPAIAGSFIPNEPAQTMEAFPNLMSKYQLLCGVTESERYHDFGVIELDHGILENQRDEIIKKYAKVVFDGGEDVVLREILKQYATSRLDPQRWTVETNRDVILNVFSDARTVAPMMKFLNYLAKSNRQSYFYVFGHNSISTDYASLNKSVHGEELPYIFGVPLGGTNTHFHSEYTQHEKLLSELSMRLWTNFVKTGTPNTQSNNKYLTNDQKLWSQFNVDWPEYHEDHQTFLKLDIPPHIRSYYRTNFTNFWTELLPNKMKRFARDPLFEFTPAPSTVRPKSTSRNTEPIRKQWNPPPAVAVPHYSPPTYGKIRPYSVPVNKADPEQIYREIQSIKTPAKPMPPNLLDLIKTTTHKTLMTTEMPIKSSSATVTLIVSLAILFLVTNIGICAIFYFKKKKHRLRDNALEHSRNSHGELGETDIIGRKSQKDDKNALVKLKNGCNVIKSMSIGKIRKNGKKSKKQISESCKTPKSDDSGGFRERFQLRRHLSTSTLDAHTKVRDWITNEVMHRCSPNFTKQSTTDLSNEKQTNKPFTRSEELLSETNKEAYNRMKSEKDIDKKSTLQSKLSAKTKYSEKTTSTSALGSHSSINTEKSCLKSPKTRDKSTESIKSADSTKSKKVSVAIDATPAARTNSILQQEPIEITKSFDCTDSVQHSSNINVSSNTNVKKESSKHFTNSVKVTLEQPLAVSHKHSTSDPITDVNYSKTKEKIETGIQTTDILPPVLFRNDINMTSRDESVQIMPLTAAESLLTIQRRKFPKVLPDLPKSQKRLSLQPNSFQTFRGESLESQSNYRSKVPPQPPPRTTTLERRLAYKNSKYLSSFSSSNEKKIPESKYSMNYENIEDLDSNVSNERTKELPKVIISSTNIPNSPEPRIVIKSSSNTFAFPENIPRVKLPEDFHSQTTDSVTSFSSFCSEDDDNDIDDFEDLDEDQLLKELVGGVESPTNSILDSKGPDRIIKNLEIVPVKLNAGSFVPKNSEDYVCVSDLNLPNVNNFENLAQIKPNFGLSKLQERSDSFNKPLEKSVKLKQKRSSKSIKLLNTKKNSKNDTLVHSCSGSSNDTESSTGTVIKKI